MHLTKGRVSHLFGNAMAQESMKISLTIIYSATTLHFAYLSG